MNNPRGLPNKPAGLPNNLRQLEDKLPRGLPNNRMTPEQFRRAQSGAGKDMKIAKEEATRARMDDMSRQARAERLERARRLAGQPLAGPRPRNAYHINGKRARNDYRF